MNLDNRLKKSLNNLRKYTIIEDLGKNSSGRAGPTRAKNSSGPGRRGPKIPPGRAESAQVGPVGPARRFQTLLETALQKSAKMCTCHQILE